MKNLHTVQTFTANGSGKLAADQLHEITAISICGAQPQMYTTTFVGKQLQVVAKTFYKSLIVRSCAAHQESQSLVHLV